MPVWIVLSKIFLTADARGDNAITMDAVLILHTYAPEI
jgi:hypothetical protein